MLECVRHKIGDSRSSFSSQGLLNVYSVNAVELARKMVPYSVAKLDQLNHLLFLQAL